MVYKGGSIGQILPHSCIPNVTAYIDGDTKIATFRTIRPVSVGEPLTISYIPNVQLIPMGKRRDLLRKTLTVCSCLRCSDPTENSTHFSSLKCAVHSPAHYLVPILNDDDDKYTWRCQVANCRVTKNEENVEILTANVKERMDGLAVHKNYSAMKMILRNDNPHLHPQHNLMAYLQLLLVQAAQNQIASKAQQALMVRGTPGPLLLHEKYLEDFEKGLAIIEEVVPGRNLHQGGFLFYLSIMKMSKLADDVSKHPARFLESPAALDQGVKDLFDDLKEAWTVLTLNPIAEISELNTKLVLRDAFAKVLIHAVTKHVVKTQTVKEQVPNFVLFNEKYMANLNLPKD